MKTLHRILTLALFLVLTTATARAAGEWIEIGTQDGVKYSMYTKITTDYAGNHSVWIMQEYVTKATRAKAMKRLKLKRTPYSQKVCYKYNSSFSESSFSSGVIYNAKGNVIESYNAPFDDFEPIVPGTLGESWAEMAQYILNTCGQ